MKKFFLSVILLLFVNIIYSQNIDFNLIHKLINTSFVTIDDLMTEGYGFKKFESESDDNKRQYGRNYNGDFDNAIIITVLNSKLKSNSLELILAKNYNIRDIKDKLLEYGYEYYGSNEYGLVLYKYEKTIWAIAKEPNKVGATQIFIMTKD